MKKIFLSLLIISGITSLVFNTQARFGGGGFVSGLVGGTLATVGTAAALGTGNYGYGYSPYGYSSYGHGYSDSYSYPSEYSYYGDSYPDYYV